MLRRFPDRFLRIALGLSSLGLMLALTVRAGEPPAEEPETLPAPSEAADTIPLKPTVTDKWTVLLNATRGRPGVVAISPKAPIRNIENFDFVGPQQGHPFCLGDYHEDGQFALAHGSAAVVEGKNALLSLAIADEFELEGKVELSGLGGWLMLIGWNQGHGYSISNVTLKDSGSPWFICEYRGNEAIVESNNEVKQMQWNGPKSLQVMVKEKQLTIQVDRAVVVENYPLDNYTLGEIMVGTYDTRYGPRPLKIHSLRVRGPAKQSNAKAPKSK